jgi:hypothetical protein
VAFSWPILNGKELLLALDLAVSSLATLTEDAGSGACWTMGVERLFEVKHRLADYVTKAEAREAVDIISAAPPPRSDLTRADPTASTFIYRLTSNRACDSMDAARESVNLQTIAMFCSSSRMANWEFLKDSDELASTELRHRPMGEILLSRVQPGDAIVTIKWNELFQGESALRTYVDLRNLQVRLHVIELGGANLFTFPLAVRFAEGPRGLTI